MYRKFGILFLIVSLQVVVAQEEGAKNLRRYAKPTVSWAKRAQQKAGGFTMWLSNQMVMGAQAWDGSPPQDDADCRDKNPGLGSSYPPGACVEHLYGAGPWFGGIVRGVRVVAQGYNGNTGYGYFVPNRKDTARDKMWITDSRDTLYDQNLRDQTNSNQRRRLIHQYSNVRYTVNRIYFDDDGDGKVDEDELDGDDNDGDWSRDRTTHALVYDSSGQLRDDLGSDDLPDSLERGCKGSYDPVINADPAFDNYNPSMRDSCHPDASGYFPKKSDKNIYTQNNGLPDHGEPNVDEDYKAVSDHDIYFGATDTTPQPQNPSHPFIGIKLWTKSYAWEATYFKCILPIEYSFINIGRDTIKDVYIGMFADMDVGPVVDGSYASKNYAAYMPDIYTAFIHNPVDIGSTPLGITLLNTPAPLENLQYVFQWHDFNPPCGGTQDASLYSCMSCEAFDYINCIKPNQSPTALSDTRFLFAFGNKHYSPFDTSTWIQDPKFNALAPGDTLTVMMAFVTGDAVENGQNNMYDNALKLLRKWWREPRLPVVPPSPCLEAATDSNGVTLTWGNFGSDNCSSPFETWDDNSKYVEFHFGDTSWRRRGPPEGHSRGGRIFEGYKLYRSEDPNGTPSSFRLLKQYDIIDGINYDLGLDTFFVDRNVRRGNTYWYAVTSFSIPPLTIITHPNSENPNILDTLYLYGEPGESYIMANAKKVYVPFGPSHKLGEVKVVPNPYYGNRDYSGGNGYEGNSLDWTVWKRMVRFINLPAKATIRIYTIAGEVIHTIYHDEDGGSIKGQEDYLLLSESNKALAPGIFVFTVESELGTQTGKFVVIY